MKDEIAARPPPLRSGKRESFSPQKRKKSWGAKEERESFSRELRSLLESQALAVLATQGDVFPYVNLVAFAPDPDLKFLLFSTTRSTRKFANVSKNPAVSVLVDNRKNTLADFRDAMAATALGRVEEIREPERLEMERIYLEKHPHMVDFLRSPTNAFLKIRVEKYIVVSRFQHVVEFFV